MRECTFKYTVCTLSDQRNGVFAAELDDVVRRWFVPLFVPLFVPSFLRSFVASLLRSIVPSFRPSVRATFLPSMLRSPFAVRRSPLTFVVGPPEEQTISQSKLIIPIVVAVSLLEMWAGDIHLQNHRRHTLLLIIILLAAQGLGADSVPGTLVRRVAIVKCGRRLDRTALFSLRMK